MRTSWTAGPASPTAPFRTGSPSGIRAGYLPALVAVAILAAVAGCAGHRQGSHGLHPATQVSVYLSLADTVTVTGSDSGQCPAFEKPDTTAACQLGTLAAGASVTVSLPVTYSNPYQETPGWWGMLQPRMGSQKYHDAQFTFGNLS